MSCEANRLIAANGRSFRDQLKPTSTRLSLDDTQRGSCDSDRLKIVSRMGSAIRNVLVWVQTEAYRAANETDKMLMGRVNASFCALELALECARVGSRSCCSKLCGVKEARASIYLGRIN